MDASKKAGSTVCISSQVGCPVDCRFCLTALMGLERSLTAGEIVGQVLRIAADHGITANVDRLNIVMMGQGEPLLNLPNVLKATRLLTDPEGMAIARRKPHYHIHLGHHSQDRRTGARADSSQARHLTQRIHRRTAPVPDADTRKYHLKDLIEACRRYPLRTWEKLTFEYVLLKGVNDSDQDARRVAKMLSNLNAKVNV